MIERNATAEYGLKAVDEVGPCSYRRSSLCAATQGWVRVADVTMLDEILTGDQSARGAAGGLSHEDPAPSSCERRQHRACIGRPKQVPGSRQSPPASSPSLNTAVAASRYPPPSVLIAPPMHRWMEEVVVAHVYVLTARNLENVDAIGMSDPYLKLQLGQQLVVSDRVFDG